MRNLCGHHFAFILTIKETRLKSTKLFITLVIIASVNVPWPTFGQEAVEGTLTKFEGSPDVVEVDDIKGDKMIVEANGANVLVSIFSSLSGFKPQKNLKKSAGY